MALGFLLLRRRRRRRFGSQDHPVEVEAVEKAAPGKFLSHPSPIRELDNPTTLAELDADSLVGRS
jgi:hypothetical protein